MERLEILIIKIKPKGHKQGNQNWMRLHMPEGENLGFYNYII
jgi:hypothetical protein